MKYEEIIKKLRSLANPKNVAGMARFGINPKNTLGVPVPKLRALAKRIGKDHKLTQRLWNSKIHEARILASMIDDPKLVTEKQINKWANDFNSWDVCDQACMNLFAFAKSAYKKCFEFPKRKEEFVRRTGFTLMACFSVKRKDIKDSDLIKFFPVIKKYSTDERNFVRKAVNWALRQIGKRNIKLNKEAIKVAKGIQKINSKSAKWIAYDAIKELESEAVQKRLKNK
ncbi:MAG: DNA alkylation repair protein [Candidatus Paceibacterota bacterium]